MVRRFVEDHGGGLFVEHAHEIDSTALTAGERVEVLQEKVLFEAQPGGEARHFGLRLVAPALAKLLFERGESLDRRLSWIGGEFVARVLHVGVELV